MITNKISMLNITQKNGCSGEIQCPHTLHISLNPEKLDILVCQTGVFGLDCNDYNSNSECSGSKTGYFNFYWLVHNS
jgi:hypothetical protein